MNNIRTAPTGFGFLLCMLAISGCQVGPDYTPPEISMPEQWSGPGTGAGTVTPEEADQQLARWWTGFRDETLTELIEEAFASNLDLQLAESRIRQTRIARQIAVSGLGPAIDAAGSFQRSKIPPSGITGNQYQAGFDASWELDVFGGTRREIEAAQADIQASVESRQDVLITLAAEVARNYIEMRDLQERIGIAAKNLQSQKHSADLTRKRFDTGFVSGLDVANADAQVATTTAVIPQLEAAEQQAIYRLSVLCGMDPGALKSELSVVHAVPTSVPLVPEGVPSELLRRRPDIRLAEAEIHAATARIGVATAEFFPQFTLGGSIGYRASEADELFDPLSRFWSLSPSVRWRIFDTGRILSEIELQNVLQEQSVIRYRQTVLNALEEVEGVLIALAKEKEHYDALARAVEANRKAVELSLRLYAAGEIYFLDVLNAQRSLFVTEDALSQSKSSLSTDLVSLYKALGGGWHEPAGDEELP